MQEDKIKEVLDKLAKAGFVVAIVGGAVRDLISNQKVTDWDLTTNARPQEILKLFENGFYNNRFGPVGVPLDGQTVEITTYRKEMGYSDKRHPDEIVWGKTLEEDLARRDFTINAMALKPKAKLSEISNFKFQISNFILVDPYNGQKDLKNKIIRTVGDPDQRFAEDALSLLRAVRFASTLGF